MDEVVIELVFDNPKIYKRYVKNSSMGKGTRVELIDFEEINDHEGGSIFTKMGKSLKQFGNSVRKNGLVRDIGKASLIAGATAAGSMLGGPMGGITAGVLAERGSSHMGLGVKQDMRKLKKGLNHVYQKSKPTMRAIGREFRPIVKDLYNDTKAHAIQSLKQSMSDTIQNEYMPRIADNMDHYTGDSYYGDRFYDASHRALESQGMGLRVVPRVGKHLITNKGRKATSLPGAKQQAVNEVMADTQQYEAVGGVVQMTAAEKMIHSRKGGSLISDSRGGFKTLKNYAGGSLKSDFRSVNKYVGGSLSSDTKKGVRAVNKYVGGSMMPLR
jgi:hypothetical protein